MEFVNGDVPIALSLISSIKDQTKSTEIINEVAKREGGIANYASVVDTIKQELGSVTATVENPTITGTAAKEYN